MPVFNQVRELTPLLAQCREGLSCDELLIIDDGSEDGSEKLIRESGFPSMRVPERRGIGHALIVGTRYAFRRGFDVVVHMAGNGKMQPHEMGRLLKPIENGECDYVWGSRYLRGGQFVNAPRFRRLAIPYLANPVAFLFTGNKVTDVTCGFRAYRLQILRDCAKNWDEPWLYGYEFEYYVLAHVLRSQYRFKEVPVSMIYPADRKNYSKIVPFVSWLTMLKPWIAVAWNLEDWVISRARSTSGPQPSPSTPTGCSPETVSTWP